MARYSSYKVLDYCLHPLKLFKDGDWIVVPCNKCPGCLLHKANLWSQRLSFEIDNSPFAIFFTLTYNNKYLPTLVPIQDDKTNSVYYVSDHKKNVRFDGSKDVFREDHIVINSRSYDIPITNDPRHGVVNYASKRDVQLWLKLIREDIKNYLNINYGSESFRYYIISEQGPTRLRWHMHGIIFPRSKEIAEFLLARSLYSCWQMCDKVLFDNYTKYCDAGTSTYVTNYVTNINKLLPIYQNPAIKPFRLSSKSPAIGYSPFDEEKVFEDVSSGIIEFSRRVSRVDQSFTLRYPSDYMARLFPKCYQFAKLSYSRLFFVYGYLYRAVNAREFPYLLLSNRLSKELHPADFQATRLCFKFCEKLGCTPFHYLYLLDMYYYKRGMSALAMWYNWMEQNRQFPLLVLSSYFNFPDYVQNKRFLSPAQVARMTVFCEDFGIVFEDLEVDDLRFSVDSYSDLYRKDVQDIVDNLVKMPKFNELNGTDPHIV